MATVKLVKWMMRRRIVERRKSEIYMVGVFVEFMVWVSCKR